jgi:hypothetical protein
MNATLLFRELTVSYVLNKYFPQYRPCQALTRLQSNSQSNKGLLTREIMMFRSYCSELISGMRLNESILLSNVLEEGCHDTSIT